MEKYIKNLTLLAFLSVSLCMLPQFLTAQDPPCCEDQTGTNCEPDVPTCPVDGGITLLIAVGIGYGVKKVKGERKKIVL